MAQRQEAEANPGDIVEYMRAGGKKIRRGEVEQVCYGAEGVTYRVRDLHTKHDWTFVAACDPVFRVWRAQ